MDNSNTPNTLSRIIDSNIEISETDVTNFANHVGSIVSNISSTVDNVSSRIADVARIKAQVEAQCAQLDHMFDCLMLKAQRDLRIYELSLPVLDRQFATCQERLDRIIDKAMDCLCEANTSDSLARQESVIRMVEVANSSLNSLISKLMPTI